MLVPCEFLEILEAGEVSVSPAYKDEMFAHGIVTPLILIL
jgi:hypothetical protein